MLPKERIAGNNAKKVYEWIRQYRLLSKLDLKDKSDLTISTLTRILEDLTEQGLLIEVGFGESTGGRRPILYQTNSSYAYVFGLEISRIYSKLILCDLHLNKIDSHTWKMDEKMTPKRLLQEVVKEVRNILERRQIKNEQILGMGIGAVGPLDREAGIILDPEGFYALGWKHVEICKLAETHMDFPVSLENGANAAILGEYWQDNEGDLKHLLYLHVGVGIRSSMIVGGQVVYGAVDMEGAVGQMIIQSNGPAPQHQTGNYGSWESFATTHALEEAAKSQLKLGRDSILIPSLSSVDDVRYPLIEQALMQNDPLVKELFIQASCYFGIGLANLLNILHPQKVIMGGPLISNNDVFYENAVKVALKKTYHAPIYHVDFGKSKLGEDAVAMGSAATVIKQMTD